MKSKHQILALFTLLIFWGLPLNGQNLRVHIFAATESEDTDFAEGIKVSIEDLKGLFLKLDTPELPLDITYHTGNDFTVNQLDECLKNLETDPEDFLIFYFLGHGHESRKSKYPQLIFAKTNNLSKKELKQNSRSLEDIYNILFEDHTTQGLLVIGDACNDPIEKASGMGGSRSSKKVKPPKVSTPADFKGCQAFFKENETSLAISSSAKGQKAYLSKSEGAFFTRSFVRTMEDNCAKTVKDFEELLHKTKIELNTLAAEYNVEQDPIIDDPIKDSGNFKHFLARIFFDGSDRRKMKRAFRNKDFSYFDIILGKTESAETEQEIRETFLRNKPASYYILSAITKEDQLASDSDIEDEAEILLDYCTAREVYKNLKTGRDINIVTRLRKLDEEYSELGISNYTNFKNWLDAKCLECKNNFEEKKVEVKALIDSLETQILDTQAEIEKLDDQETEAKKALEQLEKELEEKDASIAKTKDAIEANGNIRISIPEFPSNFSPKLEKALEDMVDGNPVNTEGMTDYEKVWLSQVELVYEPNDDMAPNRDEDVEIQGFPVGDYCTPSIKNYTEGVLQAMLKRINQIPETYRRKLNVVVTLRGFADYRGYKQIIRRFRANKAFDFIYTNGEGTSVPFKMRQGQSELITNEQLAFLRALCAYDLMTQFLDSRGVSTPKTNFTFHAIEQIPGEVDANDGKDFRGVKIEWTITNFNEYLLEDLKMQEADRQKIIAQIQAKKDEIRAIQNNKEKAGQKLVALQKQTEEALNLEAFLEDRLNQVDPDKQGTVIDNRIKEVEKYRLN